MTPTISCPGMRGSFVLVNSPSTTCRSVRHTAHAFTSSNTWSGLGLGCGTSSAQSACRGASSTIACIRQLKPVPGSRQGQERLPLTHPGSVPREAYGVRPGLPAPSVPGRRTSIQTALASRDALHTLREVQCRYPYFGDYLRKE